MSFRISPVWWPIIALSSPVLLPYLFIKNRRFKQNVKKALAVNEERIEKTGLKVQMIWGTGKPPWKKITEKDLERTIKFLNDIRPKHVFLSAHDTCDYSINRFKNDLKSETTVLRAGGVYKI